MDLDEAKRWLVSYVEQTAWHDDRTADAAAVALAALAERDAEVARLRAGREVERTMLRSAARQIEESEAEVARLRAAVDAVRELHQPEEVAIRNSWTIRMCSHCSQTGDPFCVVSDDWPCPTVAALAAAPAPAREQADPAAEEA